MAIGIGSVIGAAGLALDVIGQLSDGDDNADANRALAAREAERTKIEVARAKRDRRRIVGEQRVAFAGAHLNPDAGVALDVLADSLAEAQLDIDLIEKGGEINTSLALDAARQGERDARRGAIGTVVSGFGQLFEDAR